MPIAISARFAFSVDRVSDGLVQFAAWASPELRLHDAR